MKNKPQIFIWLLLVGFSLLPFTAQAQDDANVFILDADGPIVPAMEDYIERGLDVAAEENAELVVIQLDTPGGSVATMENIVQLIRESEVPVVVYVAPRGSMAASAGSLITLAGHKAAMAPETVIGAASPISGDGSDLNETADRKAKEILTATARSLAERRGPEAQALAESMITDATAVSATEALDIGLIDYIATDLDDLLLQMDGATVVDVRDETVVLDLSDARTHEIEMNFIERVLLILTDPTIVFTLLSLGVILIIIEMRVPGGWVAGTLGATSFVLSLYGLGVLPINYLGLVFIALAFFLFILEIATPDTMGALSATAATSLAVGGLIMFNNTEVQQYGDLSLIVVIGQSALIGLIGIISVYFIVKVRRQPPMTGETGMIGMIGEVRRSLEPQGMVFVNGENWQAVSYDGIPIGKGTPVKVLEMHDLLLTVEPSGAPKKKDD